MSGTTATQPAPSSNAMLTPVRAVAPIATVVAAAGAAAGASPAAAVFAGSAALAAVTASSSVAKGNPSISAGVLGAAATAWVVAAGLAVSGNGGAWWAVALGAVAATLALLAAVGLRALAKPATCAPSADTSRALAAIPNIAVAVPEGAGGALLVTDAAGMHFLIGEVPGDAETFENSLPYREFTAILARVRQGTGLGATDLRGVVVIPDLERFGPLRMKGGEEIVACSKSQLRKALVQRLRGR